MIDVTLREMDMETEVEPFPIGFDRNEVRLEHSFRASFTRYKTRHCQKAASLAHSCSHFFEAALGHTLFSFLNQVTW